LPFAQRFEMGLLGFELELFHLQDVIAGERPARDDEQGYQQNRDGDGCTPIAR
jgi:hypothetical protein